MVESLTFGSVAGLAAILLTLAGSTWADPLKSNRCWCSAIAGTLAATTVTAAHQTNLSAIFILAIPLAVTAGIDLHTQRAPHELTLGAAILLAISAWHDILGASQPNSWILLSTSIPITAISTFMISETAKSLVWPSLSLLSVAALLIGAINQPALLIAPITGLFIFALFTGVQWGAKRFKRYTSPDSTGEVQPVIGGGDYAFVTVTITAILWPHPTLLDDFQQALTEARWSFIVFQCAAVTTGVAIALATNKRLSLADRIPLTPCLVAGAAAVGIAA